MQWVERLPAAEETAKFELILGVNDLSSSSLLLIPCCWWVRLQNLSKSKNLSDGLSDWSWESWYSGLVHGESRDNREASASTTGNWGLVVVVVVGFWFLVVVFCYTKHSRNWLEERMPLVAERLLLDGLVTLDNLPSDWSKSKVRSLGWSPSQ